MNEPYKNTPEHATFVVLNHIMSLALAASEAKQPATADRWFKQINEALDLLPPYWGMEYAKQATALTAHLPTVSKQFENKCMVYEAALGIQRKNEEIEAQRQNEPYRLPDWKRSALRAFLGINIPR